MWKPSNASSAKRFRGSKSRIMITATLPCSNKANRVSRKGANAELPALEFAAGITLDRPKGEGSFFCSRESHGEQSSCPLAFCEALSHLGVKSNLAPEALLSQGLK